MSKAAVFAVNTNQQTFTGTGTVNLGTPLHGFGNTGCGCGQKIMDVSGTNLTIRNADRCSGMYAVVMGVTVSASEAATVTLQAYQDGNAIGAPQAATIAAASNEAAVTVPIGPRVSGNSTSVITLVATASAGNAIINGVSTLGWKM